MQRDVEQSFLPARVHGRCIRDWTTLKRSIVDAAQPAVTFCDEHVAVRQKGEAPRM